MRFSANEVAGSQLRLRYLVELQYDVLVPPLNSC